ncbi:MAG: NFACT family protein [Microcoleus sp. PH2017_10_PVI_O_A]|uniref:Rqc2 family fibronectin-binding protein n=1 Tax=unclassified Microcoleus TaxID=2642155 RepID=UPI001D331C8E|nr:MULTISPECIES: NFACT RNA binding domain-containing protein [unclassified Microcoleus]TAE85060.1 MAG: fibronectin/fibrinogen-binding protein [Oscillatoriales cyanobacterium]MCC3404795.1 NFACT family protein [Microcoleus sp. PH2017_10_PVI_O_A]MCC3458901.1 NFACT family protein [Microcoleus sp. PH2017_11_PCY_U_A]MCC3477103.1 NFACT family protein [Microcoleus sp. PH2017_12_PCY_D_A]MCC3526729.1 NFACT family protein [Microcoleus sp. PH2017_21_RUC_O_A]
MQPVDFTTLTAACSELRAQWLPARLEQVYQRDRFTVSLALRTMNQRGWIDISSHPAAARICVGDSPPRIPDTFTFSEQLRHQLSGLALVSIAPVSPWERVIDLQFAKRPGEPALWHLYAEIMGKYSNVILTAEDNLVVTCAHQVSAKQSSVRPIQTGQPYELPPSLTDAVPSAIESLDRWKERISLVPGQLKINLLKNYRGLSKVLVVSMIRSANLDPEQSTDSLNPGEWQQLFQRWLHWLQCLENSKFQPSFTPEGYSVIDWPKPENNPIRLTSVKSVTELPTAIELTSVKSVTESVAELPSSFTSIQQLLNSYYTGEINQQLFVQLRHQLTQKLNNVLAKLRLKANTFKERLQQSADADTHKSQADLLMASLQHWEPGMKSISLPDFETEKPVIIALNPEKNAVQNAQALYKKHQKLKRARIAVEPLLAAVQEEIDYLEQVEAALSVLETYRNTQDLQTLAEIREELIQQKYLDVPDYRSSDKTGAIEFHRYQTPSGFELLIGRNNRQNDQLTFRTANDYDLWFHTLEIPGSHALLRLTPGTVAEETDLQFAADMTAYYSRARHSEQVPVVYTEPKYVYKPKGAKPGMVVYKQERIVWGRPQQAPAGS